MPPKTRNVRSSPLSGHHQSLVRRIFVALLLDILAFTIILPLFPRLIYAYETQDNSILLRWFLNLTHRFKALFTEPTGGPSTGAPTLGVDTVLVGGLLGSLFSFLQFLISPFIGRCADKWGRRRVLLVCMMGNILSTVVWLVSTRFEWFLLSRVIGGLSEGNVQLSQAMIADITTETQRSRGMAWVGIAFATGFTIGPPLGAYFATWDYHLPGWLAQYVGGTSLEQYLAPSPWAAGLALVLLCVEYIFIYRFIPETSVLNKPNPHIVGQIRARPTSEPAPAGVLRELRDLRFVHWGYLLVFAGMEFTLPFLTFEKFNFSHMEQGKFLGLIGILSTVFQGAVVRRVAYRWGEKTMVVLGIISCALGFMAIAFLAHPVHGLGGLYFGAVCLSITSATVVNCMTSLVSLLCTSDPLSVLAEQQGAILGDFRSLGQLGRALGPIVACSLYWLYGSAFAYGLGSLLIAVIGVVFYWRVEQPRYTKRKTH
ncbi:hypothetical protein IWQ61_005309 [Dispira simplex]|nr:hypothetical protein IWQ61_005309 [Dispira simplex]